MEDRNYESIKEAAQMLCDKVLLEQDDIWSKVPMINTENDYQELQNEVAAILKKEIMRRKIVINIHTIHIGDWPIQVLALLPIAAVIHPTTDPSHPHTYVIYRDTTRIGTAVYGEYYTFETCHKREHEVMIGSPVEFTEGG